MSPKEMRDVIKKITYKPSWTIGFAQHDQDGECSIVVCLMTPSVHDGRIIPITSRARVAPFQFTSSDEVLQYVFGLVSEMERHEQNEYFKVDGICYRDPHPELKLKKSG